MKEILYKYRSLQNFEQILDILLCNRLYGATYDKLNDPMECSFRPIALPTPNIQSLRTERKKLRICSLSATHINSLMWSHYADGHRGCCIALEVSKTKCWTRETVQYMNKLPNLSANMSINDILRNLYTIKSDFWKYEQEVRYVKKANVGQSPYLSIRPLVVYMGYNISSRHKTLLKHIVDLINKNRKDGIELYQMTYDNINFFKIP